MCVPERGAWSGKAVSCLCLSAKLAKPGKQLLVCEGSWPTTVQAQCSALSGVGWLRFMIRDS